MNESAAVEGAAGVAVTAAKLLSMPGTIGVLAGALGFLFAWPQTRREGFCRIAAAGLCSHFFGPGVLKTALHFAPWFVAEDIQSACFLAAGLPGWWLLHWGFRWLEARRDHSLEDVAADAADSIKRIKDIA